MWDTEFAVHILDTTSEAQSMEENTQMFDLTKIKKKLRGKGTTTTKTHCLEDETKGKKTRGIFVSYVFDKRLLFQETINIEFNKRKQTK